MFFSLSRFIDTKIIINKFINLTIAFKMQKSRFQELKRRSTPNCNKAKENKKIINSKKNGRF